MEGQFGEDQPPPLLGEGGGLKTPTFVPQFIIEEQIKEKKLSFDEASRCLNTLGKDESGVRYAYLMMTARERKLTDISIILNFKHVLFIDVSDNLLTLEALQVLSGMPFLLYLKANGNRLESAALEPMYYLQCFILNKNRITETCDINQPLLETLELQDNLIYTIQFDVERLKNLKMLNLKGNQLIDFSGTYPSTLEKLFMNQNKISKILVDFSQLSNLTTLHLRDNQIRKLSGFNENLSKLTYLNLRNNKISKLREFRKLQCLPKLETLIISENPVGNSKDLQVVGEDEEVEDEEIFGEDPFLSKDPTRVALVVLLPNLKRINKDVVTFEDKEEAKLQKTKILDRILEEVSSDEETELPTTTDFTTDYTTDTEVGMPSNSADEDEAEDRKETPTMDDEENNVEASDGTAVPSEDSPTSRQETDASGTLSGLPTESGLERIKEDAEGEVKENQ